MSSAENPQPVDNVGKTEGMLTEAISDWGVKGNLSLFRRSHTSTLYRIGDLLVRSSPSLDFAKQDEAISQLQLRLPECRFAQCLFGPVIVEDLVISGWEWIPSTRKSDVMDVARFAAGLYGVQVRTRIVERVVIDRIDRYIRLVQADTGISKETKKLLNKSFEEAIAVWEEVRCGPTGVVHGDLSVENIVVSGLNIYGVDLETSGSGPQAWDMVQVLGAGIYGTQDDIIEEAFGGYQDAGGGAPREDIVKLVPVMLLAGASWALAFRHLSEGHAQQAEIRLESLQWDWHDAPHWTLL